MQKLFEGTRGEVFLIDYFGKKAVLKRLKPGKPNTLQKEAKILELLNGRYAPKLFEVGSDFLIMEYIDGLPLKKMIKKDFKKAIKLGLEACYFLDRMGVYHKELGRYYHLLYAYDFSWVKVIDFERAVVRPNPRNLLQFVGYYLQSFDLTKEIALYKQDKRSGYQAILKALDV